MEWSTRILWIWVLISTTVLQVIHSMPETKTATKKSMEEESAQDDKPKLLYILLDGFRWDYLSEQKPADLPGFSRFLREGVQARWTNPVFPTVSFPSWTTLSTGLYTESHGIVGNFFYDAEEKDSFRLGDSESTGNPKWWTSEPLWTTAEKAGLKTALYMWSMCHVPIDNIVPHQCEPYSEDTKSDNFLRNIMKALEKFEQGYDLLQVYTVLVDQTGHVHGPDSEEVRQAVRDIDAVLDILLDELEERQLKDKVNIVIVSDHGMADTSEDAITIHYLDQYLDPTLVENIADYGATINIKVPEENVDKVYEQLFPMPGAKVYRKNEIPDYFHYKNNKYVHEILIVAQSGHGIKGSSSDKQIPSVSSEYSLGSHGYPIDVQNMRGIFFAKGPAFLKGVVIDPIHMVDVYQVVTNVLDLTPRPHNGTWSHVSSAFKNSHRYPKQSNGASTPVIMSFVLPLLIGTIFRDIIYHHIYM